MKEILQVQMYYPKNELLQKFIAYYYFLVTDTPDFASAYYSFPTTLKSLNIHKNARCTIHGYSVITEGDMDSKYLMVLQGRYEKPLMVQLNGILDKITIAFKPLGLNQFILVPFGEVASQPLQLFYQWHAGQD